MRLQIIFSLKSNKNFLPANYQHHISSWIYKCISAGDKEFAGFLHQKGYGERNKHFKFFTFGPLDIRPYHFHKTRGVFELYGNQLSLQVSFFVPEAAELFIKGINVVNEAYFGDKINGIQLGVDELRIVPEPLMLNTMTYKLVSPCCISRPAQEGEKHSQYLSPQDREFVPRLIDNLKIKYGVAQNVLIHIEEEHPDFEPKVRVLTSQPKSKLITIKTLTKHEISVRGWLFECQITAPLDVQSFIWNVGLGEKGSMGFGMVDVKP
ncbi:CRISPR-associated endoribonuclease Cas6 [Fulvivirga kasyanovii]|nr:CRISPR-associated endoribonuclease Cas6 [Fulvivirga kasyanovii]